MNAKAKDLDFYGILEISHEATEREIVKAYRKKALKCHPDKNPDNPKAAELFHQLTKALEVLTDAAARAAFDKTLRAKKAAELRHAELDSKRKKFKEDLEAREHAAQDHRAQEAHYARNLEAEIERLRKEGSKLVESEKERLEKELKEQEIKLKEREDEDTEDLLSSPSARLKVRWKAKKSDPENGGYSDELLNSYFSKYGEVTALLVSVKKKGSAVVEFSSGHDALLATQNEIGLPSNPLTLSWLSGQPSDGNHGDDASGATEFSTNFQVPDNPPERDFESLVLRRMRQAEERKRLTEEIKSEDDAT